jgi:hypothetical protein
VDRDLAERLGEERPVSGVAAQAHADQQAKRLGGRQAAANEELR